LKIYDRNQAKMIPKANEEAYDACRTVAEESLKEFWTVVTFVTGKKAQLIPLPSNVPVTSQVLPVLAPNRGNVPRPQPRFDYDQRDSTLEGNYPNQHLQLSQQGQTRYNPKEPRQNAPPLDENSQIGSNLGDWAGIQTNGFFHDPNCYAGSNMDAQQASPASVYFAPQQNNTNPSYPFHQGYTSSRHPWPQLFLPQQQASMTAQPNFDQQVHYRPSMGTSHPQISNSGMNGQGKQPQQNPDADDLYSAN